MDALRRGALAGGLVLCLVVSASGAPALGFLVPEQALPLVAAADALPAMRSLPNPAQAMFAHIARTSGWPAEARAIDYPTGPGSLEAAVLTVYANMRLQTSDQQRAQLHASAEAVDPVLRDSLARLLGSIADGQQAVEQALRLAPASGLRASMECGFSIECMHEKSWPEVLTPVGKALMAQAAADILGTAERVRPALEAVASETPPVDGLVLFQDPFRLVEVGGTGSNLFVGNLVGEAHPEIHVLSLDLGGDDLYLNSAGGAWGPEPPLGPCVYDGTVEDLAVQCLYDCTLYCSYLVSIAYDLQGDDTYVSNTGLGAALRGVGILIDAQGNDTYSSLGSAQGSGSTGVGVLVDLSGLDTYTIGSTGQGKGAGGLGLLVDIGGNDAYTATDWRAQGIGLGDAAGWLADFDGDDIYTATTVAQAATDLGVTTSALLDFSGSDSYWAGLARGYVKPWPILTGYSNGLPLFYDYTGTDTYGGGAPGADGTVWFQGSIIYNPQGVGIDRP